MDIFETSSVALDEEFGENGSKIQDYIKSVHVILIGLGGLGSVALTTMAGLGITHFTLIDGDIYERSNAPRQFLAYFDSLTHKRGHLKTITCKKRLNDLYGDHQGPSIYIISKFMRTSNDTKAILKESFENEPVGITTRIIVDTIDEIRDRGEIYKGIRSISMELPTVSPDIMVIWGNAFGFRGMTGCHIIKNGSCDPRVTSCYQCLYPNIQSKITNAKSAAVVTTTPFLVGSHMTVILLSIIKSRALSDEDHLNRIHRKVTIIRTMPCEINEFNIAYESCSCDVD